MENLKNVGSGPVSAQKKIIGYCPEFLQKNIGCNSVHSNFKGITLIALIITVIVILILVGVTITVALNGGLFETATKAATETKKETERERLTEVALASYNVAEGKISDVDSLIGKLSSMGFSKDESKSSVSNAKLVVQGKSTLWQIDLISAKVEPYRETYTFTVGELGSQKLLVRDGNTEIVAIPFSSFWRNDVSEALKKSATFDPNGWGSWGLGTYNIMCSDSKYSNVSDIVDFSQAEFTFGFRVSSDYSNVYLTLRGEDDFNNNNYYEPYADLAFTISMPE